MRRLTAGWRLAALQGCCCVWGVLTPLILFILVYALPDLQIEDTEGGSWTATVARLLLNFCLQTAVLGVLLVGTRNAKNCRCSAAEYPVEPEYPLRPLDAATHVPEVPDGAQLVWQSSLASGGRSSGR
jgi:hypothetical protein